MNSCCIHLNNYLDQQNHDYKNLDKIFNYIKLTRKKENSQASNKEIIILNCKDCSYNDRSLHLHICLSCGYIGCFKQHIKQHFIRNKHLLAIDLQYGAIYCFHCKDYQYNEQFEDELNKFFINNKLLRFGKFSDWESIDTKVMFISKTNNNLIVTKLNITSIIGLRGLLNLGNTCFMNCILQALIHTPMLRDYFLSDLHICSNMSLYKNLNSCLVCELSILFQEFYSGKRAAYIPFNLLYLIWTQVKHLAGYEQQDAHEFFIATLNAIHKNCVDNDKNLMPSNNNNNNKNEVNNTHHWYNPCSCIIDRIFSGCLQSDLICTNCNNVSTKVDPFWDISLDLGRNNVVDSQQSSTLEDCLKRFTHPEVLASFNCSFCKSIHNSTKQLTLRKLPIVACFHLKRFEQSIKYHKKIPTHIAFPERLDMSPFMSTTTSNSKNDSFMLNNDNNQYMLFAVVNHHGTIESGHYTCYIRLTKDQWFKCDDHLICKATIDEVLSSEGYLLFYHQLWLNFNDD